MKPVAVSEVIRYASNLSVLFPLVIYASKAGFASRRIHIIGALLMTSAAADALGYFQFSNPQSSAMLFNMYYMLTFALLSWFYYEILFNKHRRAIVWIGVAVYVQSFALITIFVQPFSEYQTLMWIITGLIMIIYSTSYFLYSLSVLPTSDFFHYTPVWINSGVLIYFILNLFLFIMSQYVFTALDSEMAALIWSFHNANNILKNLLFAIGLSFVRPKIASF